MPTLRQLEYLVALEDLQHFGRAAQASHVSQPTLSQQLRALEERLGATLIDRHSANGTLTPIGRDIAERARGLIVEVKNIRELARRSTENAAGIIRLGTTPTLGPYLLPSVMASLKVDRPSLKLYIREGIPHEQSLEVSRGKLDVIVGPLPLFGNDLTVEPLLREPLRLIAPYDHPIARVETVSRDDLKNLPVIGFDPRHHLHQQIASICEETGMRLLMQYEGTSLDTLRLMSFSGLGLAILPEFYCQQEVYPNDSFKAISVSGWSAWRSIGMTWLTNAPFEPIYRDIANIVQTRARMLLGAGRC
jgi:LysR family transcriptional regulator, hydrogen peroxide-inducible genes activator